MLEPERAASEEIATKPGGLSLGLVKLSDDPNWPDVADGFADPELFAD